MSQKTYSKKCWRFRNIDSRFKLNRRLGLSVSFEIYQAYRFYRWLHNAETHLNKVLGPAAHLSVNPKYDRPGRWASEYDRICINGKKHSIYRLSVRDRKILTGLLIAVGDLIDELDYPEQGIFDHNNIEDI